MKVLTDASQTNDKAGNPFPVWSGRSGSTYPQQPILNATANQRINRVLGKLETDLQGQRWLIVLHLATFVEI